SLSGGKTVTVTGRPRSSLTAEKRLRATRSPIRERSRHPGMWGAVPDMTTGESTAIRGAVPPRHASYVRDPSGLALLEPPDLVLRQHVPHVGGRVGPVGQQLRGARRAGELGVPFDQPPHL